MAGSRRRGEDAASPLALQALAPLGRALLDAYGGRREAVLVVHTDAADPEHLPLGHFLRAGEALDPLDRGALAACRGRVLDLGAGAGALSLPLQEAGHAVTALDMLPEAIEVLRARGALDARPGDLWTFRADVPYDTVLLLMNGVALAGTAGRLPLLLDRLAALVAPGGQVILDSTDLGGEADDAWVIHYQLEYLGEKAPPFPQLFVPFDFLRRVAEEGGWRAERLLEGDGGRYLARLVRAGLTRRGSAPPPP